MYKGQPEALGASQDWLAEWKWDGIRAQLVIRAGQAWLWSRGEELISDQFPEVLNSVQTSRLDTQSSLVLDGELLAWDPQTDRPRNFGWLKRRLQRKRVSAAVLRDIPVRFMAYDLLEQDGHDLRDEALAARRARLEVLSRQHVLRLSEPLPATDWSDRALCLDLAP